MKAGIRVAGDVLRGRNLENSLKRRGVEVLNSLVSEEPPVKRTNRGRGRGRGRQQGRGRKGVRMGDIFNWYLNCIIYGWDIDE